MIRVQINLTMDIDLSKVPIDVFEQSGGDVSLCAANLILRDHEAITYQDRRAWLVGFPKANAMKGKR
ncbi:MAG: hypothetical protein WC655_17220 [Candidatus Hydrogenedentales bacterium]|jgi:hypothetical protein